MTKLKTTKRAIIPCVAAGFACALPQAWAGDEVKGWGASKVAETRIDRGTRHGGAAAASFAAKANTNPKQKTLLQSFLADEYRGKRVRFSAYVRCQDLSDWAGLWMRVDTDKNSPSFDNMMERPIGGTTDWTKHDIVLEVPADAEVVTIGLLLVGDGKVWIDDASFDVVPSDTGTTKNFDPNAPDTPADLRRMLQRNVDELRKQKKLRPTNLDFES
jgi:hypothetical protein